MQHRAGGTQMELTILSGIFAAVTAVLYGLRFVNRKSIGGYDFVADVGGHFLHGVFMFYMAIVMLGASTFLGWNWIAYLFGALVILFLLRTVLVIRAKVFGFEPLFKFERHSKWWWDPLHATNHLVMVYMFLDMSLWQESWTYLAIANSALILVLYVKKIVERLAQEESADRTFAFYSDIGHVTMALSMILMLYVMQWSMGSMSHGATHHDHSAHMTMTTGDDRDQVVSQLKKQFETPESPLSVNPVALSGGWAVAGWSQNGQGGRGLLQKSDTGWFIYLCSGSSLKDYDMLVRAGVPEADARLIVEQLQVAEDSMTDEAVALQDSFEGTVVVGVTADQSSKDGADHTGHEHHH